MRPCPKPCSDPKCDTCNAAWGRLAGFIRDAIPACWRLPEADAEDIAQEICVILTRRKRHELPEDLRGFAVGIIRKVGPRWLRRRERERLWTEHFAQSVTVEAHDRFTLDVQMRLSRSAEVFSHGGRS